MRCVPPATQPDVLVRSWGKLCSNSQDPPAPSSPVLPAALGPMLPPKLEALPNLSRRLRVSDRAASSLADANWFSTSPGRNRKSGISRRRCVSSNKHSVAKRPFGRRFPIFRSAVAPAGETVGTHARSACRAGHSSPSSCSALRTGGRGGVLAGGEREEGPAPAVQHKGGGQHGHSQHSHDGCNDRSHVGAAAAAVVCSGVGWVWGMGGQEGRMRQRKSRGTTALAEPTTGCPAPATPLTSCSDGCILLRGGDDRGGQRHSHYVHHAGAIDSLFGQVEGGRCVLAGRRVAWAAQGSAPHSLGVPGRCQTNALADWDTPSPTWRKPGAQAWQASPTYPEKHSQVPLVGRQVPWPQPAGQVCRQRDGEASTWWLVARRGSHSNCGPPPRQALLFPAHELTLSPGHSHSPPHRSPPHRSPTHRSPTHRSPPPPPPQPNPPWSPGRSPAGRCPPAGPARCAPPPRRCRCRTRRRCRGQGRGQNRPVSGSG